MPIAAAILLALAPYRAADVTISYANGISPTYVLGLDDNLDICLASREPSATLKMTGSQRVLLQAANIIKRTAPNTYQCQIPVFDEGKSTALREQAAKIADTIAVKTAAERTLFLDRLAHSNAARQSYAVVASLVLDGLTWPHLLENADASAMETGSKLWSGFAWIIIPPGEWKVGTNTSTKGDRTVYETWSPGALPALEGFNSSNVAGPVIESNSDLYASAESFSSAVAKAFQESFDRDAFTRSTGVTDRSKATLIMYHEVFPALLQRFEREGVVPPGILVKGEPKSDIDQLTFVVRIAR